LEKKRPHYDLASIKVEFCTPEKIRMSHTGLIYAETIGLGLSGLVTLIQGIERTCFYKSMTSYADHRTWQDVYHVPWQDLVLYMKFTVDSEGFFLISFKEK
jgi:motility quorum-sensing regulator/GCU-specific mRNA interferase toxin